jgi:hypothetical protein
MRSIAPPFVVAAPTGARIRTRLRLGARDEQVLRAVGEQLGQLAGWDMAVRCRLGHRPDQRADRKRALTAQASSRWAGRSPGPPTISGSVDGATCSMPGPG